MQYLQSTVSWRLSVRPAEADTRLFYMLRHYVRQTIYVRNITLDVLGSISAALSCLVSPPREETAGRVGVHPCPWRNRKKINLCVLGRHESYFRAKKQHAAKNQHEKSQTSLEKKFASNVGKMDGVGVLANASGSTPTKLVTNSGCLICGSIQNDSRRRTSLNGKVADLPLGLI